MLFNQTIHQAVGGHRMNKSVLIINTEIENSKNQFKLVTNPWSFGFVVILQAQR